MLAELFVSEGYDVDVAFDGHRGLHLGLGRRHQVMVIDRMLPGIDGLDLVKRLRRVGVTTRVLVLTALGELGDRVTGLDSGADDYLVKPFEVDELLARVRALHRRDLADAEVLPLGDGDGQLDLRRHEVCLADGSRVELSLREFGAAARARGRPQAGARPLTPARARVPRYLGRVHRRHLCLLPAAETGP